MSSFHVQKVFDGLFQMIDAASFFFNENDRMQRIQLMNHICLQCMNHYRQPRNYLVYVMDQGQVICIRKIRVQNYHVGQGIGILNILNEFLTAFDQSNLVAIGHHLALQKFPDMGISICNQQDHRFVHELPSMAS